MSKENLYSPNAPYLYVASANVSEITDYAWSLARQDTSQIVVRFLRGKKMKTASSLFDEFAAALQFPYYFGENWNAFDECIRDLDWLPGDVYIMVITDSEALLLEENGEQLDVLINILQKAGDEWSRPVELSEAWDRPAVAFHVIFQCNESGKHGMMSRLKSANAHFQEMHLQNT